jgi:hypothetical protein
MASDTVNDSPVVGFKGAVTGLSLSDVIQLKAHNLFSGCILVEYGSRHGEIYFQDGEVVHVEQGDREGEEAFYTIMSWPGGRFDFQDGVMSSKRSIEVRLTHLLLEAHRLIDEQRYGETAVPEPEEPGSQPRGRTTANAVCARLMKISGVSHAVMFGPDGASIEDSSSEAISLAGDGGFLVKTGSRLGELFGVGALKSVARQDSSEQQLLFEAKNVYLALAVTGGTQLSQVEAEIRKAFAAKR